jgi:hypothetical protein
MKLDFRTPTLAELLLAFSPFLWLSRAKYIWAFAFVEFANSIHGPYMGIWK